MDLFRYMIILTIFQFFTTLNKEIGFMGYVIIEMDLFMEDNLEIYIFLIIINKVYKAIINQFIQLK